MKSVQIRIFSGPLISVFSPNIEKYGPEKTPCLETFHTVLKALKTLTIHQMSFPIFFIKLVRQHLSHMTFFGINF